MTVGKKHKHYDVIVAWATGAQIQFKGPTTGDDWIDRATPSWHEDNEYRVKPEPKPDVVEYVVTDQRIVCKMKQVRGNGFYEQLKLTRDGETGEIKSVEIIKGE